MDTEPFHSLLLAPSHNDPSQQYASYFAAPWLHTRTRKRVRDNRPADESQIHSDTVRRLFDAQRGALNQRGGFGEDLAMATGPEDTAMSAFMDAHILTADADEMDVEAMGAMEEVENCSIGAPEANQRSIHDFFARMKGKEREEAPVIHANTVVAASLVEVQQQQQSSPLREKRSFGVLSGMNGASGTGEATGLYHDAAAVLSGAMSASSCLPCDFRSAEVVVALMEDAMVMG
jgi:hypothetical protein